VSLLKQVADQLVTHCRNRTEAEGLNALYSRDAVSVEAMAMPGSSDREARGLDAIRGKHDWWDANHEVHEATVEGPFLHGEDRFGVIFGFQVTNKQTGERMPPMKELGIYHVADGKIVREEFFYTM
jgi:hypothetical protein